MRRADPLIIGGGPAGSAAAITLAQGGARPRLIERSAAAHESVCGAFLGWDALARLEGLGIDPAALGARPIERVRVIAGATMVERALPGRAAALSRRALDAALLARAASVGAMVEQGIAARHIDAAGVLLSDGRRLPADALFLATGKHNLRGSPRSTPRGGGSIGLRLALATVPALEGVIELHLFRGGYAGLLLQEDGRANLCLSLSAERFAAAGGSPDAVMIALAREAPLLAARWAGADGAWSAVAAVPYGWRARTTAPGCFRIGDQAAVIASLAGDGIAIALASGRQAAEAWLSGGAAAAPGFQRGFARHAARPIRVAEALRHVAERPRLAAPLVRLLGGLPEGIAAAARLTRIGH